jgi:peptidoglycan hydrolase-like protein with peptidoglycan-binding domain
VDDRPVPLFYGGMPLFRALRERTTIGRDVRIVADNLRALGYPVGRQPRAGERIRVAAGEAGSAPAPSVPSSPASAGPTRAPATRSVKLRTGEGVLTGSLITAIKRWQRDAGLPETGAIAPRDVVVQVAAVRVGTVAVQPGAAADGPLMSVTPTEKVITVRADPAEGAGIEAGAKVTVELPDGSPAPGKVTAVGTELKPAEGGAGDAPPQLAVTVTVDDPKAVRRIDAAEVTVNFAGETRAGVLAVPVTALLALSEGGYAVQVEGGQLVAVETGMFAKGMVEVSGAGLAEGTRVVTTS